MLKVWDIVKIRNEYLENYPNWVKSVTFKISSIDGIIARIHSEEGISGSVPLAELKKVIKFKLKRKVLTNV